MELNRKILFGLIQINMIQGNGGWKTEGSSSWYVSDYIIIYKAFGIILHSVTINSITIEQAKELIK